MTRTDEQLCGPGSLHCTPTPPSFLRQGPSQDLKCNSLEASTDPYKSAPQMSRNTYAGLALFSAGPTALQTERHMKQPCEHTRICSPDTAGNPVHYITPVPQMDNHWGSFYQCQMLWDVWFLWGMSLFYPLDRLEQLTVHTSWSFPATRECKVQAPASWQAFHYLNFSKQTMILQF